MEGLEFRRGRQVYLEWDFEDGSHRVAFIMKVRDKLLHEDM